MSATKLIQKVGLGCAKAQVGLILELSQKHEMDLQNVETFGICVDVFELKQFVESLEIINDLDGIKGAKDTLYTLVQLGWDEFEHRYIDNWFCTKIRLEQAIADCESIYR
ncbi:TPA: hypothetical protein RP383_003872, partial [Acinetobacter baumannii]|nr:hypothetical protein [Acinetobacter baumannii]HDX5959364.1 hypothetical protein [Acinetobacter baumannii]